VKSTKIKIVHLVNYLAPAGKEVGIVKLLNALNDDFEPVLVVLGKVYDALGLNTDKTRLIELGKGQGNDFSLIPRLKKIFKEVNPHMVHTHSWGTLVEGVLAAKWARVPIIIHGEHGTFHKDFKRKWVQKIFFSLTDQILSVSALLADQLSRDLGIKRTRILPILNGVDVQKFAPDAAKRKQYREQWGFGQNDVLIGTVGRPMKVKNHQLMIRALKRLREQGYPVHFAIVGDTPLRSLKDELVALAQSLGVADRVHFLGFQSDVPGYLNMFDIFVLPSLSEGCSNVIQEAMATGLPIVASRVGGNPELVQDGETGLLFESNSVEALARALQTLLDDPQKAQALGNRALQRAREAFSLEKMVENYEALYYRLLKEKNLP
jgi:sugar transferase (PEP-CTERM/EpsH1 system associated)